MAGATYVRGRYGLVVSRANLPALQEQRAGHSHISRDINRKCPELERCSVRPKWRRSGCRIQIVLVRHLDAIFALKRLCALALILNNTLEAIAVCGVTQPLCAH